MCMSRPCDVTALAASSQYMTAIIILVSGLSFISERIDVRGMEFCSLTSRITAAMSGNN